MTAPPFISLPVPAMVTITPKGNGRKSTTPGRVQKSSQISPGYTAAMETALQQSMTLPPPTPRIKSTPFSLARAAPFWTLA